MCSELNLKYKELSPMALITEQLLKLNIIQAEI